MKRICFIDMGNIDMVPFIKCYSNSIPDDFDIIYWNRKHISESYSNAILHCFDVPLDSSTSKIRKIHLFFKYRRFVKRILKREKYDLVVCLQTWCALLVFDVLLKLYKHKYIVDIRDYTYEKNPIVFFVESQLLKHAKLNVISSKGYKSFLPQNDYVCAHNIVSLPRDKVSKIREREKDRKKIVIGYVGNCNYPEMHKKLLLCLKNDLRFEIKFYGTRALELVEFCKENEIANVDLRDTFHPDEALDLYKSIDVVNNLYGSDSIALTTALSNKLYYAVQLHMPIIVCPKTYMAETVIKYGLGTVVDLNSAACTADDIWNYYHNLDWEDFEKKCDRFLLDVENEQDVFLQQIRGIMVDD